MYTKGDKSKKALGAIESKLLTTLSSEDKTIFSASDAQEITGGSKMATNLLLDGLVSKKWLIRLMRGKYLIVPLSAGMEAEHTENWYIVAKHIIEPAQYYISYFSALDIHDMLVHPLITIYISSPARRIPKNILGATFRFIYTQPKDIWGVEDAWVTTSQKVKVSDLERTIIDCLDRPDLSGGISEIAKAIWTKRNNIDYKKLVDYTKKMGRKSVIKRLGFLLETYDLGDPEILKKLRQTIKSRTYSPLDPTLPKTGKYLSSWKLIINIEPEELITITQT